jgi:hypothetical protein
VKNVALLPITTPYALSKTLFDTTKKMVKKEGFMVP